MNIDKNKLVSARENALMNQFELSQASKVDLSLSDGGVAVSEQKAFLLVNTRRSLGQSPAPRLIRIDQITSMSVDFKEPKIWVIYETGSNGMTSTVTEYFKSFDDRDTAWASIMTKISETNNVIRSDSNGCDNE